TVRQRNRLRDLPTVEERPVAALEVLQQIPAVLSDDASVPAGHHVRLQLDRTVGMTAENDLFARQFERGRRTLLKEDNFRHVTWLRNGPKQEERQTHPPAGADCLRTVYADVSGVAA